MATNIKLNIVEPGTPPSPTPTPTPVDPSTTGTTDISVPNTGLFTHGIGGPEATIISAIILLAVAAIVVAVLYNKHKKQGKVTKLVHAVDQCKAIFSSRKRITASLSALALLASAGTLAALLANSGKGNTSAVEGNNELTVDISGDELTVEVGDEPVFAVAEVKATVAEAAASGYTLTAYAEDTNLVSTTDESNIIPMVATDEGELVALAENTYGLSLAKPESQDDESFTALSTDADAPTFITDKDYEETGENDTTTIYYGFYITPDTPYGTYEGGDINYEATANRTDLAKVTFDGNGLYFNSNPEQTTNVVRYGAGVATQYTEAYSHTKNVNDAGVKDGMYPINTAETFVYNFANADKINIEIMQSGNDSCSYAGGVDTDAYFSFWSGGHPEYTAEGNYSDGIKAFGNTTGKYVFGNYNNVQTEIDNTSSVTFAYHVGSGGSSRGCSSGYGYYAIITATDADGNSASLLGNELYRGTYEIPSSEAATKFLGWSTEKDATAPMYGNERDIALGLSLATGADVTLYAVWQPMLEITYNGNGADTTTDMNNVVQSTTKLDGTSQVDLLASNFTKEGYGFVGWSTDQNAWDNLTDADPTNDPTIYGPNQTITINEDVIAEAGEDRKLVLNAVWTPAETTASGDPVALQDWQGCSNLTATTYDSDTGTLNVGKNTITALTDNRDGNIYAVARLADGNCWMTENLRLNNEPELSSTNTNNPSLPLTNNYAEQTTSNKVSATSNDWCTNTDSAPCYNQSKLNTNNTALTTASPSFSQDFTNQAHKDFDDSISSYSNYYNWYSATAGNGKQETTSTVAGDLCPAGWHLPYGSIGTGAKGGNTSGGFHYLNQQLGGGTSAQASKNWRSFPNNFVYSGFWHGSSAYGRGNYGYYWSSTARNTGRAYFLHFGSDDVLPGTDYDYKSRGYSVRCVISQ